MYPGMGFILTVNEKNAGEVCSRFSAVGMTAKIIGTVNTSKDLIITYEDQESLVFDFSKNGIMRLFTGPGDGV
jgi:selenophosphate synthetase-related protein